MVKHMHPIKIYIEIDESIMDPTSNKKLNGTLIFLETWTLIPTFCFISNEKETFGATYHDIPYHLLNIDIYNEEKTVAIISHNNQRAEVFEPPINSGMLYDKNKNFKCTVHIYCGLIWEKANIILYLCKDTNEQLYLWPPHKILFSHTDTPPKLPNWQKNRY